MTAQSGRGSLVAANLADLLGRLPAASADLARSIARWWLREFLALFPARLSDWLTDRGRKTLVLVPEPDAVLFELFNDRRRPLASARVSRVDYGPELVGSFLQSHKLQRQDVAIGCRLPPGSIFVRKLLLPVETERTLAAVLAQDMLAKTPFRLEDVYHDHAARRSGDKLAVAQWIVRRQFVETAVNALGLAPDDLAFVETDGRDAGDDPRPLLKLRELPADRGRWARRMCAMLVLTACVLTLVAIGSKYWRQEAALDNLTAELSAAKHKAQRVRAMIERLEGERADLLRLRSEKRDAPGLVDVWEELSRLLPFHSWLTELRVSEGAGKEERQIVLSGLSSGASSLVGLLDRSALLGDAVLSAPIAIDRIEEKERFVIQAKLKRPDQPPKVAP
jgi:general secretion pathway protein L